MRIIVMKSSQKVDASSGIMQLITTAVGRGFMSIQGAINAWRNASLDSAKYSMEIDIGDKSNWLLPAIFPRVGKFFNDFIVKPASTLVAVVWGPEAKEAPPAPEIPEKLKGSSLESAWKTAYEQKCKAVDNSASKWKCYASLDFSGARQYAAAYEHETAKDRIALPENYRQTAGVSASTGTFLGGLVNNDTTKGLAAAAIGVLTGKSLGLDKSITDTLGSLVASTTKTGGSAKATPTPTIQA
ncbi:MAG: hypothetical protein ACKVOE_02255 [Rickettsiales bacterium]